MKTRLATAAAAGFALVAVVAAVAAAVAWPTRSAGAGGAEARAIQPPDIIPPVAAPLGWQTGAFGSNRSVTDLAPERLVISSIGVNMPVKALGLAPDGSMALVERADTAAWYKFGAAPGDRKGAALIAAHVASDIDGVGPFSRLGELRGGDGITVTMSDGSEQPFTVVKRERVAKTTVDYADITADSDGMLVLVTCSGDWDARNRHYTDNVIVWAASLVP